MSQNCNYYLVSLENVPQSPTHPVWFATWSSTGSQVSWSQQQPQVMTSETCLAVVVQEEQAPDGATLLGGGAKDLPPPPGSFSISNICTLTEFKEAFADWGLQRDPG